MSRPHIEGSTRNIDRAMGAGFYEPNVDPERAIFRLLVDLRHWAESEGFSAQDVDRIADGARMVWAAESGENIERVTA